MHVNKVKPTEVLRIVCDTIMDIAQGGRPSGEIYALLMSSGVTLEVYNLCLGALVKAGRVTVSNHFVTTVYEDDEITYVSKRRG